MRASLAVLLVLAWLPAARAQTPDDVTQLVNRVLDLESVDLTKNDIKFRSGLEPMLLAFDADESGMIVLKDPRTVQGQGKVGAAGWYRFSFEAPAKLGKLARPVKQPNYALGIESNLLGGWEIYTYVNGKRAGFNGTGALNAPRVVQAWSEPPTTWRSNAQLYASPGDKVTVVILAMSSPIAESTDGYGLRHLRLRFAGSHTAARQTLFSALHNARDRLTRAKGDELKALQDKLKGPLDCLPALTKAAETEDLNTLSGAMSAIGTKINAALMK